MNFTIFVRTYFVMFKIIPSDPKKFQYNVFINMFLSGISLVLIAKMIKTTVHGCHLEARKITSFSNKNTGRFSIGLQQKDFSVVTARKKLFEMWSSSLLPRVLPLISIQTTRYLCWQASPALLRLFEAPPEMSLSGSGCSWPPLAAWKNIYL